MATVELAREQLLIGGRWIEADGGKTFEQTFPYTGDPVGRAAAAGRADAHAAVDAAHAAFGEWGRSAPGERRTILTKAAVEKGATTLSGGEADGACYPPTVITGVTPEMRVYGEESFGPLVSVVEVDGVDEAVATANDTEYGLSAAVWSENVPAALELAQRIESGICHINDTTVQDEPQMPFGGVKVSGWGRFGGRAALEEFTELRWITIQELPRQYPI
jgi:benzaldehyde dehydrogenase (NAD)